MTRSDFTPMKIDILRKSIDLSSKKDEDSDKTIALLKARKEQVEIAGRAKFYDLREKWSWWIILWISCLIGFNSALAVSVGLGLLDFSKYEWFITIVTVETFLQVVGMGYVAVRFLFSDQKPV